MIEPSGGANRNPSQVPPPSESSQLERTISLASEACYMVALQRLRLRSAAPEDEKFLFRWWADLQFLIVALRRLRLSAQLAAGVPLAKESLKQAISHFDAALPGLNEMRNVGEHIVEYSVDSPKRHHAHICRQQLQNGGWDGTVFSWLGHELNIDSALNAAESLFSSIKAASKLGSSTTGAAR